MARRSLRPQLNQIRAWVQQGRTDAWIAHQLEVTTQQIDAFKRENDLAPATSDAGNGAPADFDDEIDLRAQDDEQIAAELEKAEAERAKRDAEEAERKAAEAASSPSESEEDDDEDDKPKRSRGRRGGRGRSRAKRKAGEPFEATFDHGEEGYGLWLDPAIADDPVYAEHWAGHRPVTVVIEDEQIIIRRAGDADGDDD